MAGLLSLARNTTKKTTSIELYSQSKALGLTERVTFTGELDQVPLNDCSTRRPFSRLRPGTKATEWFLAKQ